MSIKIGNISRNRIGKNEIFENPKINSPLNQQEKTPNPISPVRKKEIIKNPKENGEKGENEER